MKWNIASKRFLLMLMVMAVWTATLALRAELFMQLTPYVVGLLTGYMGFETWKPSGQ